MNLCQDWFHVKVTRFGRAADQDSSPGLFLLPVPCNGVTLSPTLGGSPMSVAGEKPKSGHRLDEVQALCVISRSLKEL